MYTDTVNNLPNSVESIQKRISNRSIIWIAPVLMVLARPVLALLMQGITIIIFTVQGNPSPASASTAWWTVYGNFIDIGCLILLVSLLRREGIKLFDLVSFDRKKLPKDILLGIVICALTFPVTIYAGSTLASILVYGKLQPDLPAGALIRSLPLWGVLYSRIIWWVIWSFTEELTFQGYALPRLKLITGHSWTAVLWVGFGWALQHSFLPFINISHAVWLFIAFFPLTIALQLIYLRLHRLTPLIVAHWMMDLGSVIFLVSVS